MKSYFLLCIHLRFYLQSLRLFRLHLLFLLHNCHLLFYPYALSWLVLRGIQSQYQPITSPLCFYLATYGPISIFRPVASLLLHLTMKVLLLIFLFTSVTFFWLARAYLCIIISHHSHSLKIWFFSSWVSISCFTCKSCCSSMYCFIYYSTIHVNYYSMVVWMCNVVSEVLLACVVVYDRFLSLIRMYWLWCIFGWLIFGVFDLWIVYSFHPYKVFPYSEAVDWYA